MRELRKSTVGQGRKLLYYNKNRDALHQNTHALESIVLAVSYAHGSVVVSIIYAWERLSSKFNVEGRGASAVLYTALQSLEIAALKVSLERVENGASKIEGQLKHISMCFSIWMIPKCCCVE